MSAESNTTEIRGSHLGAAFKMADELGFRPTDPAWEKERVQVARHEGWPLEDLPWYTQFAAIHHLSPDEAQRLADAFCSVRTLPEMLPEVEQVVKLLIDLGQRGGVEFGYIGHHYFVGPEGSVTALLPAQKSTS
jgi:hypothetical protein